MLRTKVSQETQIVPLHRDTGRDDDTPTDGLGVQSNTLEQGHRLFLVGSEFSIVGKRVLRFFLVFLVGMGCWRFHRGVRCWLVRGEKVVGYKDVK